MPVNCRKWLEIAGNGWNCWKWLELAEYGLKGLDMAGIGWKWVDIAGMYKKKLCLKIA